MKQISPLAALTKPQYLFQPHRIVPRLWQHFVNQPGKMEKVDLPWGLPLNVDPREVIGRAIYKSGVHEVVVTEVLWRLTEQGETVMDIGANIGYTASILAHRVGTSGKVHAFEPHPFVFDILSNNIKGWNAVAGTAAVKANQMALSHTDGEAMLAMEEDFAVNNGTSKIREGAAEGSVEGQVKVQMKRFDHFAAAEGFDKIGVVKIDVEGHELPVLQGFGEWLTAHKIRDIVFEEWDAYPAATHKLLQEAGYKVFSCEEKLTGIELRDPALPTDRRSYDSPCFLATIDEARARRLLAPRGWKSFGLGRWLA